jgi:hypothetical protein
MWSTIRPVWAERIGELAELARLEFPAEGLEHVLAEVDVARLELGNSRPRRSGHPWWRWFAQRNRGTDHSAPASG